MLLSAGSIQADENALRQQAQARFGVLPAQMPGAQNDTPELVELGRQLYFDKALSINHSQSCNTCHRLDGGRGGDDNNKTSPGAKGILGARNAPTVLNAGFAFAQFWDGRAADLVEQAKGPILNPVEMAMPSAAAVEQRISAMPDYQEAFAKAFGSDAAISFDHIAQAIAAFERTLITHDRFDQWQRGDDSALSAQEQRGLQAFISSGCVDCHNGPLLGGQKYKKMGLINPYANTKDKGRMAVTGDPEDAYFFKVPTLRNVALTAPYFHDGEAASLQEAVKKMGWLQLGRKLNESQVADIVAFLNSLSMENPGKFQAISE
ncbi:MAG: cytochrome-c peroxidase [Nitrococcus sp.]|nr:cytochrome-c peroxidase [Nitrococcus sp.]